MSVSGLHRFRTRLGTTRAQLHYAVLGVLAGAAAALVVLAFRWLIETATAYWMPLGNEEFFEALPWHFHLLLPIAGAIILGLVMQRMDVNHTQTGIPHVVARLHSHRGHLPLRNAVLQFFGGALALISGQSGGREGPAVHLGAATNSLLAQYFKLPNNSVRILVGCGAAAGIAASFNTPIAGVIFAMEVVMLEYTIAGFTPVILAAVTATTISRFCYGDGHWFSIPPITMNSLLEIPYIMLLGFVVGLAASTFVLLLRLALRSNSWAPLSRLVTAGAATGLCAMLVPEIMGVGYDSLNQVLAGTVPLRIVLAIIVAKLLATAISCGMGMPIGLVGPNLLIGACIGGAMGTIGAYFYPELHSGNSFYVMLGMGAMMGAVLNAPLAALLALVEMTQNTVIIFPAMLAIVIASLTTSSLFGRQSAQQTVFKALRQHVRSDPLSLVLQRTSVVGLMNRSLRHLHIAEDAQSNFAELDALVENEPEWVAIEHNGHTQLCRGHELTAFIAESDLGTRFELAELPGSRVPQLALQATLREALDVMDQQGADAVLVSGALSGLYYPEFGVLTRKDIETHYRES